MLLDEEELKSRLESPLNLLNRLKNVTTKPNIPSLPPSSDEVIENLEDKITIGSIKGKALNLMSSALDELKNKLPEVSRPEKLAAIAADMGKVFDKIDVKRDSQVAQAQIIIYAPKIVNEEVFNVVQLTD